MNFWLNTFEYPVHVVVYEDLQKNTIWELYKISKFVNFPVTFQILWCIKRKREEAKAFLREKPKWVTAKNLYSSDLKEELNGVIRQLITDAGDKQNLTEILSSYLM